jgi:hypothetical protein
LCAIIASSDREQSKSDAAARRRDGPRSFKRTSRSERAEEDLPSDQFVAALGDEALATDSFLRTARRDAGGLRPELGEASLQRSGGESRIVVGMQVGVTGARRDRISRRRERGA